MVYEQEPARLRVGKMCGARRPRRPALRRVPSGLVLFELVGVFWGPQRVGRWVP